MSHEQLMDRVYRRQRHFYDATRWLFLPGRDRLLDALEIRLGERVLEVGCGTARNLIVLARRYPSARFYGLDASGEMLKTAAAKVADAGLSEQITLCRCLAEELDHKVHFNLDKSFDAAFFSYSLTMMPSCVDALEAALRCLKPGGRLCIVDFWDLGGWPRPLRWMLKKWLALFHVRHRPEIIQYLDSLARRDGGEFSLQFLVRRYAFITALRKPV